MLLRIVGVLVGSLLLFLLVWTCWSSSIVLGIIVTVAVAIGLVYGLRTGSG